MRSEEIENIGLTKGESKIYLALLRSGETTTGRIIDESGVSSGKVYEILEKLMQKGLVTFIIKEKTKYFSATNPQKLLEYVETKKSEIEKKENEVKKLLPNLSEIYGMKKPEYSATIFKGIEGLRTAILEDLENAKAGEEYLSTGVSTIRSEGILTFWEKFEKIRIKRKINAKYLMIRPESKSLFKDHKFTKVKLLPITESAPLMIFKESVIIFNWDDVSLIKITNKNIAQSFREFFNALWNVSKK